jgi:hypothetical protein
VSVLEPRVNLQLLTSLLYMFEICRTFVFLKNMWNFVWADKALLFLSAQTKFHIQNCNTCRSVEKQSPRICYGTMVQYSTEYSCRSKALDLHIVNSVLNKLNLVPSTGKILNLVPSFSAF